MEDSKLRRRKGGVCFRVEQKSVVVFCTAFAALLLLTGFYSPISGYVLVQCAFKSYYPVDNYAKSGKEYDSLSAILEAHSSGGFSSTTLPTDKATMHHYIPVYDKVLAPYKRANEEVRLLEVGVKKGGSMKLWREYFPQAAQIFGADVDSTITAFPRDMGIKTVVLDSTDQKQVKQTMQGRKFDIIVDDGCHRLSCIRQTFLNLLPFLKTDGVYIVEDFPAYFRSKDEKIWSPQAIFGGDDRVVCFRDDTDAELVVLVYPKQTRARFADFCPP